MSAPRATKAQLLPVVEAALGSANGQQPGVVLVHADPASTVDLGDVRGRAVTVIGSSSPLQIRAALRTQAGGSLVVLTDATNEQLGDDLLARVAGRKVRRLDRWATVCQLFGATRPSPALAKRPALADALIEAKPLAGYPRVTSRVLDLDTATAALVRTSLGVADDIADLAGFILWASRPDAAGRLSGTSGSLLDDLRPVLVDRFGPGVDAVIVAVLTGHGDDLTPLGLVAGLIHEAGPDAAGPASRLDERLGRARLTPAAYRAWGDAAATLVDRTSDQTRVARWLERAETLLGDYEIATLAHRSPLLRTGFEQRITRAAAALSRWHDTPSDARLADEAEAAIVAVECHRDTRRACERVHRLRMVARLVRRGGYDISGATDLAALGATYQHDGAWLDAARVVVSRGDADAALDRLCARLTADADAARAAQGQTLARVLAAAAHPLPAGVIGVEDVIARVVAPLAEHAPVLLLVLDGLGLPTYCDVIDAIEAAGWAQYRPAGAADTPVAVAALPTVTEVSRTSLLCGTVRRGDDGSESRGFAGHEALRPVTRPEAPPLLFHKRELRTGGLDTRPDELLNAIADSHRQVVGLVINTIDERLKDVAQPVAGWTMDDLDPLREVLNAARRAGRTVVLTADHGHILDRDAEARPAGGGGERWRTSDPDAADGEIVVAGPRVVADGSPVVMPWREQVHYGTRRNGYHGGLTPQEVFVPLAVLAVDDLEGWPPTTTRRPTWWHHTPLGATSPTAPVNVAPEPAGRRPPPASPAPTLFESFGGVAASDVASATAAPLDVAAPAQAPGPARPATWVGRVLAAPAVAARRRNPRVRLDDDVLGRLLGVLERAGTTAVMHGRLAQEAQLPPARIGRYVAQLQDLLNVDGYAVVTVRDDEVRFDRALLERQLEL